MGENITETDTQTSNTVQNVIPEGSGVGLKCDFMIKIKESYLMSLIILTENISS